MAELIEVADAIKELRVSIDEMKELTKIIDEA